MEKQRGLSRSRCSGYKESLIITSKKPPTVLCHLSSSLHVILQWGTWQGNVCYKPFPISNSPPPTPCHCSFCRHDLRVYQENTDLFLSLSGDVIHLICFQKFSCMLLEHHSLLAAKQLLDPICFFQCSPGARFAF